jgi:Hydrazine synthase alpha subunit middle domain
MASTGSVCRVLAAAALLAACSGQITDDGDEGDDGDNGGGGGDGGGDVDEGPYEGELGTILFVTQVPVGGLGTLTAPFGNHLARMDTAPRGGDLMIRYPDGTLRNLTREAGFGEAGEMQGASSIAVREPTVHFSGNRALFSMVVGGVGERYDQEDFFWQIYEVSGLARDEEVAIRRIDGQPAQYNNVSPIYGSDDSIIFASDRPRGGEAHLYPQLDEYESQPTTAGIYRLDESGGDLELIEHAPSGVFSLSLDSFGRVIFTKWDHLQRDQQADAADVAERFEPITFASEAADATTTTAIEGTEVFPEARDGDSVDSDPAMSGHRFNQFFAWEMNQDGSGEETLNHVGRQEWGGTYSDGSFRADENLDYEAPDVYRGTNVQLRGDGGVFHIRQDPTEPGWYLATEAPEFGTATGGDLVRVQGDPEVNPEEMRVERLTANDSGNYRNPLRLTDGTYVAVHTPSGGDEEGYGFRLVVLSQDGDRHVADQRITAGIERTVSWFDPDQRDTFSGNLWELDPVEVAPREVPPLRASELPEIEQAVFDQVGVDAEVLSTWLRERELALVIGRNVTQRDRNDVQQPYNLAVPGGVSSVARGGTIYDVSGIQFFQGDQLRAYEDANDGRRVLARPMHGANLVTDPDGPAGSVALGLDGSMAAFVPARRAMSWQLVGPDGGAVVRERNWVSFRAGEIRVCAACHGINRESQTGDAAPTNQPAALVSLLESWLATQ